MENTLTYIDYGLFFGAMLLGLLAHMLKKLANLNKQGTLITPIAYFNKHPYQTSLSVIGGICGYLLLVSTGELSFMSMLMMGYMADSFFERDFKKQ